MVFSGSVGPRPSGANRGADPGADHGADRDDAAAGAEDIVVHDGAADREPGAEPNGVAETRATAEGGEAVATAEAEVANTF